MKVFPLMGQIWPFVKFVVLFGEVGKGIYGRYLQ